VSKFKEWKRQHFCGRPLTTLSIATPLSTVVQATTPSTPVSRLLAKEILIQITFGRRTMVYMTKQRNRENRATVSFAKPQVTNCPYFWP